MVSKNTKVKEGQAALEKKRQTDFVDAVHALEREHGFRIIPVLNYGTGAIQPQLELMKIGKAEDEPKK